MRGMLGAAALMLGVALAPAPAAAQTAPIQLRVAGHYTANNRHTEGIERPFFMGLGQETGINLAVTFNPMDQVGAAAADALRNLRNNVFDVMSVLMGQTARDEPFVDAMDLMGVSTTLEETRAAINAGREALSRRIQERFNARVMTLWPFGAQIFFCNRPVQSTADLRALRVRSYTPSMSALLQHMGAVPVTLQLSETYQAIQRGTVECGITSATSAYSANWGEVITHILPVSLASGVQGHFMTMTAWRRFNPQQQEALTRAFARLEEQMWDYARTSHEQAIACFTGQPACTTRRFNVTVVTPPETDARRVHEAVSTAVLPGFRDSCNRVWSECSAVWNRTVGQARGYAIP
ncbi:MAG TPA: TRAP transporter substrate-binding protein [Acetobacteraceae bacterium]|nr:TRAP transporter substrate-binding protein [Acetobacteraceae bacterium]